MSIKALMSLEVENFEKFFNVFSSSNAQKARDEAGINSKVHKNVDKPNNVIIISEVCCKEVITEFMTTSQQKERMKNAGVLSPPTITWLESI
ncbi:MAG: hypothetical protein CL764_05110 [Chloroflexi bacterium]|nr:hypothetical protein [Chloroflexota bacterium]|tara:strand:- start:4338 stop:4613 length:276 start_codon:yes stop_codon:yes gene_type:complete